MIKRIVTIVLVFTLAIQAYSQSDAADRYAAHSVLASGKWVKIRVKNEGVYAITKSKLQQMGFSNPDKVCLYGYNLPILPETYIENINDDLTEIPLWRRNDGSLLFYSPGTIKWQRKQNSSTVFTRLNNPYSSYIYYFVTEKAEGQPANMEKESVTLQSSLEETNTFPEHSIIEKDEISLLNSGRTFFESDNYQNGNKKSYTISTKGIAAPSVTLNVQFVSTNGSKLTVKADSTTFSTITIRNIAEYEFGILINRTFTFEKSLTESSTVTLTHTRETGISGHLDYIIASYTRKLDLAGSNYLAFRSQDNSSSKRYAINGANENTHVWCVSTPNQTHEMVGTLENGKYVVNTDQDSPKKEYVAVNTNATFPEPDIVGTIKNQDLHALSNIDYVIIVPANNKLTAQAQRLADAHTQYDSLRCVVVRADEIYNEFSSGTPDATAYRRFMKMLYDKAETPEDRPKNLCLFGDGVWDNRMITQTMSKNNPDDYLLCYESDNSLHHTDSYVLEEYYTLLADAKGIRPLKDKPDCGVGRIPVTTANEARNVVDKLIGYISNSHAGTWKNTICFMADDGNANTHMKDADGVAKQVEAMFPDYRLRKIYWDSYNREESGAGHSYPDAYNDIMNQMEEGALIMNYTGHGSARTLSHEQVLKRADFEEWSFPYLPLWFIAACDITPFDMHIENIATTALMNPKGAAVGMVTTTRTVYAAQNSKINLAFMKHVLAQKETGRQYTLGEALAQSKSDLIGNGAMSHRDSLNKVHYVLIGDPAISLPVPTYKVQVDKINNISTNENTIQTISAGSIVSVQGHIVDEDGNEAPGFNGIISPTVFDNLEFITCNNNAKEDVTPFQFYARTRTLFAGSDSIKNGRFDFTFPVPLDINYSDEKGLMCFYAINSDKSIEANGNFHDFAVGGTDQNISNNKQGPILVASLNGEKFSNASTTDSIISNVLQTSSVTMHETPYFIGVIQDENGINTTGSGIGHEITVIVDNDPNMTFDLNRTFKYATGTWTTGSVYCSLPELSTGKHQLLFRAWDILNNPSTLEIEFDVFKGLRPNMLSLQIQGPVRNNELTLIIENDRPNSSLNIDVRIFDMAGREVWNGRETGVSESNYYTYTCNLNGANGHLQPGVYICKASISTANGAQASDSKKFLVVAQ